MSLVGNNTKPSLASTAVNPTDTVVRQQQQGVTDAQATVSTRAENLFGIAVTKGGQVLGIGFFDGILAAYSNLSYQPVALVLAIVSFLYYINKLISGVSDDDGINIYYTLTSNVIAAGVSSEAVAMKSIAWLISKILSFIHTNGDFFTLVMAMWFPYFAKPSKRNGIIATSVTLIYLFMITEYLSILAFSHCFFLFTQLRSPTHKFYIAVFAVVTCIIGHEMMYEITGMSKLTGEYKSAKSKGTLPLPTKGETPVASAGSTPKLVNKGK